MKHMSAFIFCITLLSLVPQDIQASSGKMLKAVPFCVLCLNTLYNTGISALCAIKIVVSDVHNPEDVAGLSFAAGALPITTTDALIAGCLAIVYKQVVMQNSQTLEHARITELENEIRYLKQARNVTPRHASQSTYIPPLDRDPRN